MKKHLVKDLTLTYCGRRRREVRTSERVSLETCQACVKAANRISKERRRASLIRSIRAEQCNEQG